LRRLGLDLLETISSGELLLTSSRRELLYVRDEIARINQHLQIKDFIDQTVSNV
jgi:hypothetical protein